MADWSLPASLTTPYADALAYLKARDVDAISLAENPTNPASGFIRWNRTLDKFQEYDGAAWVDQLIAIAGGGTGAATAADARTNLGIGTLGIQAANNVSITGGTISGLSSLGVNGTITGQNITGTGVLVMGSGAVQLTTAGGKIQALTGTYLDNLSGAALTALNASALASGTVAPARLGTGSGGAIKFLREDSTWQEIEVNPTVYDYRGAVSWVNEDPQAIALGRSFNRDRSYIVPTLTGWSGGVNKEIEYYFNSDSEVYTILWGNISTIAGRYSFQIVEW